MANKKKRGGQPGESIAAGNLHHKFFVDYYERLRPVLLKDSDDGRMEAADKLNQELSGFTFKPSYRLSAPKEFGMTSFELKTTYPGLLVGLGIPHAAGVKGEIGVGFIFDYVTGLPYIPGSTVKGVLRSAFRLGDGEFVQELLVDQTLEISDEGRKCADSIVLLETDIFDKDFGGDVFFDAFPHNTPKPLGTDNLAPAERTQTPNVITLLRVRPGVSFRFCFKLTDSSIEAGDGQTFTFPAEDKQALFKRLMCELGIGAKTNVGYGSMVESVESGK